MRGAMWVNGRVNRFADPMRCPDCARPLSGAVERCPGCGLLLSGPVALELLTTLTAADRLLERLRAASREPAEVPIWSPVAAAATPPYQPSAPAPPPARGLPAVSVPTILLGLGVLCLLVAALIFLVVAWSWLGVGGRTAVLIALTSGAGAAGALLGRRRLRLAAEALTTVALGLLALDVVGAADAGWLGGRLGVGEQAVAVGSAVGAAALLPLCLPNLVGGRPLVVLQVVGPLAWSLAALGLLDLTRHDIVVLVVAVLGSATLVEVGRRWSGRAQVWAAGGLEALWWLALLGRA